MEHFLARQPIFDAGGRARAYELLFRSGLHNYFDHEDQDRASARVMVDSNLLFDLDEVTGNSRAFINCTKRVLLEGLVTALPPQRTVVEILEDVDPDDEVIAACRRLKRAGYTVALDDFQYHEGLEGLLDLADIVKVDFLLSDADEQRRLAEMLIPRGIRMLAEKVETCQDYLRAKGMGYQLFQGYFFAKPKIISRRDVPANNVHLLRLLKQVHAHDVDFDQLARTFQNEISLSYKLLKLINSAAFGLRHRITSIRQALSFLGIEQIRCWLSLLLISSVTHDQPEELIVSSLIRAKLCQRLAAPCGMPDRASDMFLMGLFSLLDAIVSRPIDEILGEIAIECDIAAALTGTPGPLRSVLDLAVAMERGDWCAVSRLEQELDVAGQVPPTAYVDAVRWARDLYSL